MTHQFSTGARRHALAGFVLISTTLISLLAYRLISRPLPIFLTIFSPAKKYEVFLKGQKSRPIFFTTEVHFDVVRDGRMFVSDKFLSSADSEDLPFEFRYPNQRWINEQSLQFFREEHSPDSAKDTVVVLNNTSRTINYLKIASNDIVLIFEMEPGFKGTIVTSRPKADLKWFDVSGEFSDGTSLKGAAKDIPLNTTLPNQVFYLDLKADRTTIETSKQ